MITKASSRHPTFKTHSSQENIRKFKINNNYTKIKPQNGVLNISRQGWLEKIQITMAKEKVWAAVKWPNEQKKSFFPVSLINI